MGKKYECMLSAGALRKMDAPLRTTSVCLFNFWEDVLLGSVPQSRRYSIFVVAYTMLFRTRSVGGTLSAIRRMDSCAPVVPCSSASCPLCFVALLAANSPHTLYFAYFSRDDVVQHLQGRCYTVSCVFVMIVIGALFVCIDWGNVRLSRLSASIMSPPSLIFFLISRSLQHDETQNTCTKSLRS